MHKGFILNDSSLIKSATVQFMLFFGTPKQKRGPGNWVMCAREECSWAVSRY